MDESSDYVGQPIFTQVLCFIATVYYKLPTISIMPTSFPRN
jgi:hypothetical protein